MAVAVVITVVAMAADAVRVAGDVAVAAFGGVLLDGAGELSGARTITGQFVFDGLPACGERAADAIVEDRESPADLRQSAPSRDDQDSKEPASRQPSQG